MKITPGTDPIIVEHPVLMFVGDPGIGKTSLGYSADAPLNLDFDRGAHRAANRKDTLQIATWTDVDELMSDAATLAKYKTIIPDTVGRCLDVMTAAIIDVTPKYANQGNLTQQGWGVLKSRFRQWLSALRAMDKDVLLIAHAKEEKDNDVTKIRADIVGGSYGEVMKVADCVGYLYMSGKERILDFNPTEKWVGKNPGQWAPFRVPSVDKAGSFMADLFAKSREALGKISEEGQDITKKVDGWRIVIAALETPDACTSAVPTIAALPPILAAPVKKLLLDRSKALGLVFNKQAKRFEKKAA